MILLREKSEFASVVATNPGAPVRPDAKTVAQLVALKRYWSARTWADEADAQSHIKRCIREDNERYPMFGPTDESIVDQLELTRAAGGKVKIKANRAIPLPKLANPIGQDGPQGSVPNVSWHARDNCDDGTPASVMGEYGRNGKGRIYQAWIDLCDLPSPTGEDITDGRLDGDSGARFELSIRGGPPPVKVRVTARGKLEILDGNHRLAWWAEQGFDTVPAYVIDERPAPDLDASAAHAMHVTEDFEAERDDQEVPAP